MVLTSLFILTNNFIIFPSKSYYKPNTSAYHSESIILPLLLHSLQPSPLHKAQSFYKEGKGGEGGLTTREKNGVKRETPSQALGI